jgi:D-threo-aldose 1-dehydrogenase
MVSRICVGTSPLASVPTLYGYEVSESRALATLGAVWNSPFNFIDTSNGYGDGRAETLIGRAMADLGGLPEGFVLATKVDPAPRSHDFSGDRVRRSAEESLIRLGLDGFQVLYLHDPDLHMDYAATMRPDGPVAALLRLKDDGIAKFIGVATGSLRFLSDYLATGMFDVILNHNHFTLLERDADVLINGCVASGVAFVNAAPYGGGILARGAMPGAKYAYAPASDRQIAAVRQIQDACARYGVPLPAAALQFSLNDDRVASTVIGISAPERIAQTMALARQPIPADLWDEIERIRIA